MDGGSARDEAVAARRDHKCLVRQVECVAEGAAQLREEVQGPTE